MIDSKINKDNVVELYISESMLKNSYFEFNNSKSTLFYVDYCGYKVLIYGNYDILLDDVKKIKTLNNFTSDKEIPEISYNGASWDIKIKNNRIIKFENLFCEINEKQKQEIVSISIPKDWLKDKK